MKTVKEVSELTGVSVRTLHHYHAIGLLVPSRTTAAGYRLYDNAALARLQSILLFRELDFPLREIKTILDAPGFDQRAALTQQIRLLELRRDRLEQIIALAREILETGESNMEFTAFDTKKIEAYAQEAKDRWGETAAYQEFCEKAEGDAGSSQAGRLIMECFQKLGCVKDLPPEDPAVQSLVARLQEVISHHFYNCTPEIFQSLGLMYTADPRFQENIDKAGGPGTAAFAQNAILIYCKKGEA